MVLSASRQLCVSRAVDLMSTSLSLVCVQSKQALQDQPQLMEALQAVVRDRLLRKEVRQGHMIWSSVFIFSCAIIVGVRACSRHKLKSKRQEASCV